MEVDKREKNMSVLVCQNLTYERNNNQLIKDFSYNFLEKKVYAIIGKSDSNSRDLLNLLCAKNKPTSGIVYLDGKEFWNDTEISNRVCFIPNDTKFPPQLKLLDIFKLMNTNYPKWDNYYAYELLNYFNINPKAKFSSLQHNEKSLLFAIISLASKADITIMDNPVGDADIKARFDFYNFLFKHQATYPRTFIISTELIEEMAFAVDKILLLDKGVLIENFTSKEIKQNFCYLTGKTDVLRGLISGLKIIGYEEHGQTLTVCCSQKLNKDLIRKFQKYFITISEVPIQKVLIYLINLRERKGIN